MTTPLQKYEKHIAKLRNLGQRVWYEEGLVMLKIRDEGLYKRDYETLANYMEQRWEISKRRGHQLLKAAEFIQLALQNMTSEVYQNANSVHFLPVNERQVRLLVEGLSNHGERLTVWQQIATSGEKLTNALIEQKINEFKNSHLVIDDVTYEKVIDQRDTSSSKQKVMYNAGENDECYTPEYAVKAILQYLPEGSVVWCPFDDEASKFVTVIRDAGFKVIHSHIKYGQDFYTYEPSEHWDVLVSNPPFTSKREIFERAISFNKPFALVMSNTWLNDAAPKQIFRDINFQLLMFEERMKFLNQDNSENKITFSSSFFCRDFLPKTIVFDSLREYGY